jgi:diadenosine tetraphosphate (Ap4A) HIT family hydrolase
MKTKTEQSNIKEMTKDELQKLLEFLNKAYQEMKEKGLV